MTSTRLIAATLTLVLGTANAAAGDDDPVRTAVVVGANAAAPGRKALRFAHRDAEAVAAVLDEVGGFDRGDIHLLRDPDPDKILGLLDRELARAARSGREMLLFFYYSGHADSRALYPSGQRLALRDLKRRLTDKRAAVRVGVIDACRGGGWTGTKGLTPSDPFEVDLELGFASKGTALIASSSGLEDAHESAKLRGSFFTHHFTVGLRGAGDGDSDGLVTLSEAFDYAKTRTVRDTALHTESPQNPSFRINLRGRRDLPLSQVSAASTRLTLTQAVGPLELIHLDSGLVILEIPRGKRAMTLAVPPGRYVVRREKGGKLYAVEIEIAAGRSARVAEAQLTLVGSDRLAVKGDEDPEPDQARDEISFGFLALFPGYDLVDTGAVDPRRSRTGLGAYFGKVTYLLRTDRYLGVRFSAGGGRQDSSVSGEGAVYLGFGYYIGWPLGGVNADGRIDLELYAATDASFQFELNPDQGNMPLQAAFEVAAGVRAFGFFAEAGAVRNLYPRFHELGSATYDDPSPGLRFALGLRFANTLFRDP